MIEALLMLGGMAGGVLFAAWRMRSDDATTLQNVRRIVPLGGGGPAKPVK
jgi:hypothetical protein